MEAKADPVNLPPSGAGTKFGDEFQEERPGSDAAGTIEQLAEQVVEIAEAIEQEAAEVDGVKDAKDMELASALKTIAAGMKNLKATKGDVPPQLEKKPKTPEEEEEAEEKRLKAIVTKAVAEAVPSAVAAAVKGIGKISTPGQAIAAKGGIAQNLGTKDVKKVVTGPELAKMSDKEFLQAQKEGRL